VRAVTWASSSSVLVTAEPALSTAGCSLGAVNLSSVSYGSTSLVAAWTYRPAPVILSVTPSFVPQTGGFSVTIAGSNLGNGSDITEVLLGGLPATAITSQTSSEVRCQ